MSLAEAVHGQRWFGARSHGVTDAQVIDEAVLRDEPRLVDALVELRFGDGNHDLYQLLLGPDELDRFDDEQAGSELVDLLRRAATLATRDGQITFEPASARIPRGGARRSRVLGVEQSNSALVVDDTFFVKIYRRLAAGENPELELMRFLDARGFQHMPALYGSWSYAGPQIGATLGIVEQFVPDSVDGWTLALGELREAPQRFVERAVALGTVIGELHRTLASDGDDPAFCPEQSSPEALAMVTATVDDEIEQVFLHLPERDTVAPIVGHGDSVRELLRSLSSASSSWRQIRRHGDLHLGQLLWADGRWLVIDFEGEPARGLPERRSKSSPLRDVAGMLRSFGYAASVAGVGGTAVEQQARSAFLDGYAEAVRDSGLLPAPATAARLLRIFELEKAVYELQYELAHRPDWVPIPVAAILRLLEDSA